MKKKIALFILITFTMVCFSGCSKEEKTEVNTLEVNRTSTDITNTSLNNLSNNIPNNLITNNTSNESSISSTPNKTEEMLARFFY